MNADATLLKDKIIKIKKMSLLVKEDKSWIGFGAKSLAEDNDRTPYTLNIQLEKDSDDGIILSSENDSILKSTTSMKLSTPKNLSISEKNNPSNMSFFKRIFTPSKSSSKVDIDNDHTSKKSNRGSKQLKSSNSNSYLNLESCTNLNSVVANESTDGKLSLNTQVLSNYNSNVTSDEDEENLTNVFQVPLESIQDNFSPVVNISSMKLSEKHKRKKNIIKTESNDSLPSSSLYRLETINLDGKQENRDKSVGYSNRHQIRKTLRQHKNKNAKPLKDNYTHNNYLSNQDIYELLSDNDSDECIDIKNYFSNESKDLELCIENNDEGSMLEKTILIYEKIQKCNLFETCCNLISLMTGSGLLALPFAGKSMGWSCVWLLCLTASMYIYTLYLISRCIEILTNNPKLLENVNVSDNSDSKSTESTPTRIFGDNKTGFLAASSSVKSYSDPSSNLIQQSDGNLQTGISTETNNTRNIKIDYLVIGKAVFGEIGGQLVATCLSIELLLALVSFFINIGMSSSLLICNLI